MAKAFAKAFYNSEAWKITRAQVLRRDLYTCERCGKRAEEVHHEIELSPNNIDDTSVTLNTRLLHSLCHDCHTKITQRDPECAAGFMFDENGQITPRRGC